MLSGFYRNMRPTVVLLLLWSPALVVSQGPQVSCPQYIDEGNTVTCYCQAQQGFAPAKLWWPGYSDTPELKLQNVLRTLDGVIYTCQMDEGGTVMQRTHTMHVAYGPDSNHIWINTSRPVLNPEMSQTVTLTCITTEVNPAPKYSWSVKCDSVSPDGSTCMITLRPQDEKNVTCTATNTKLSALPTLSASRWTFVRYDPTQNNLPTLTTMDRLSILLESSTKPGSTFAPGSGTTQAFSTLAGFPSTNGTTALQESSSLQGMVTRQEPTTSPRIFTAHGPTLVTESSISATSTPSSSPLGSKFSPEPRTTVKMGNSTGIFHTSAASVSPAIHADQISTTLAVTMGPNSPALHSGQVSTTLAVTMEPHPPARSSVSTGVTAQNTATFRDITTSQKSTGTTKLTPPLRPTGVLILTGPAATTVSSKGSNSQERSQSETSIAIAALAGGVGVAAVVIGIVMIATITVIKRKKGQRKYETRDESLKKDFVEHINDAYNTTEENGPSKQSSLLKRPKPASASGHSQKTKPDNFEGTGEEGTETEELTASAEGRPEPGSISPDPCSANFKTVSENPELTAGNLDSLNSELASGNSKPLLEVDPLPHFFLSSEVTEPDNSQIDSLAVQPPFLSFENPIANANANENKDTGSPGDIYAVVDKNKTKLE